MRSFFLFLGVAGLVATAIGACDPGSGTQPAAVVDDVEPDSRCGGHGMLRTEIYGAIETRIDWSAHDLECAGMPRPEGRGARLRLAGQVDKDHALAIILALPDLSRNTPLTEFDVNVTLIEEGNGRFFSTPDLGNCLAEIDLMQAIDESDDRHTIRGSLYCVSPLPEINGSSSVSIPELHFSGLIDWGAS